MWLESTAPAYEESGMRAYVITLRGNDYSERKADRCIQTGKMHGVRVERFEAVPAVDAERWMLAYGLKWTWAKHNTAPDVCPVTGLKQHPYGTLTKKIGCSMSHFLLWWKCMVTEEPLLILEHDAVFVRPLPDIEFDGICQINDPKGATPRGDWWSDRMKERGPGVFPVTHVFPDDKPDGLAGNSAYLLKPHAAAGLVKAFKELGVWPNDATMCRQLFNLEELYPFVTRVEQEQSTTT